MMNTDSSLLSREAISESVSGAIRQLKLGDGAGAREILTNTINPWFYASYPMYARDLESAEAHTRARWYAEQAARQIDANNLDAARALLSDQVLPWLNPPTPDVPNIPPQAVPAQPTTPTRPTKKPGRKPPGVLGADDTLPAEASGAKPLRALLIQQADARQIVFFNRDAALQKQIFVDGLVPNSGEFKLALDNVMYVAQRAEHLLTGEVRVYYAPTTNVVQVAFVIRDDAAAFNAPFKGGNRITQSFGERPEYYQQFGFAGHEGVDMVTQDGDRDIYCIEGGMVLRDIDIPGDPKVNAYGNYVIVFNATNRRMWYYCHMSENRVQLKQVIKRGDIIGRMGGTGNTQGDHLHLNLKLLDASSLPLTPNNGFRGLSDPLPLVTALNAAQVPSVLREMLLEKGEASQVISFNTNAALQKHMFEDSYCPNSPEFNLENPSVVYVAQRAEDLNTGAVRVYYAPTTNFGDVKFVEK